MAEWTIAQPWRMTFDEPVRRLDVLLMNGRLNVVGTDGPPRIEVTLIGRKALRATLADGKLSLRHEQMPKRWYNMFGPVWWFSKGRRDYRTHVSIAVPHEALADLRLVSGELVASDLRGQTTVDCTSGQITLLGLDGRTTAKMVSGPIQALHCSGDMDLETISGEISVAESTAHKIHAKTVSGSITADLDSPEESETRLYSTSGSITIRVREDSNLAVSLSATSGRVTSAFPSLSGPAFPGLHSARGVLGSGTGRLNADAVSGSVSLLRRPAATFDEEN